ALAIAVDRMVARRWSEAIAIAAIATVLVSPWLAWLVLAAPIGQTQAGLMMGTRAMAAEMLGRQLIFYVQRLPDQIVGPFVEVAAGGGWAPAAALANLWAALATTTIVLGWRQALTRPRLRLVALIPLLTLAILLPWPYQEAGRFLIPLVPMVLLGAV